jgi:hypothetical protein
MDKYITNPAKLKFDPNGSEISEELKPVFENKLARTLWIGIKQRHLASDLFEGQCLKMTKTIEKDGVPESTEKLEHLIYRHFGNGYSKEFIAELLPYVTGKKDLEYEVVK